jgi:hypothetical protein
MASLVAAGGDAVRKLIHDFSGRELARLEPRWAGDKPSPTDQLRRHRVHRHDGRRQTEEARSSLHPTEYLSTDSSTGLAI